jgi:hypothetical protein
MQSNNPIKQAPATFGLPRLVLFNLVAGSGFEPLTFGL